MTATTAKRLGEDRFGKLAFGADVGRAVQILHGAAMSAIAACASHGHADIGKVDGCDADGGAAIRRQLGDVDAVVCYQSRVGPLKWIGPATDEEIRRAGREGKKLVVVPIAFVSEHSETLVELDIEYKKLAEEAGAKAYVRVPALGVTTAFVEAMAQLVMGALSKGGEA
jgi:hypothetical protein